jgi:hypothetical protein
MCRNQAVEIWVAWATGEAVAAVAATPSSQKGCWRRLVAKPSGQTDVISRDEGVATTFCDEGVATTFCDEASQLRTQTRQGSGLSR